MKEVVNKKSENIEERPSLQSSEDRLNAMFSLGVNIVTSFRLNKEFGIVYTRKLAFEKDGITRLII